MLKQLNTIKLSEIASTNSNSTISSASKILFVKDIADDVASANSAVTARSTMVTETLVYRDVNQCSLLPRTGTLSGYVDAVCDRLTAEDATAIHSFLLSGQAINEALEALFPAKLRLRADAPRINAYDAAEMLTRIIAKHGGDLSDNARHYITLLLTEAFAKFGIYMKVPVVFDVVTNKSRYTEITSDDVKAAILRSRIRSATAAFLKEFSSFTVDTTGYLFVSVYAAQLASYFTALATNLFFAVQRVSQYDDILRAVKANVTGLITKFDSEYHAFIASPAIASLSRIKEVVDAALLVDDNSQFTIHHSIALVAASEIYAAITSDSLIERVTITEWLAPFSVEQSDSFIVIAEKTPTVTPASKLFYSVPDSIIKDATRYVAPARENDYAAIVGLTGALTPELKVAADAVSAAVSDAVASIVDSFNASSRVKAKVVIERLVNVSSEKVATMLAFNLGHARVIQTDEGWRYAYIMSASDMTPDLRTPVIVKYGLMVTDPSYIYFARGSVRSATRAVQVKPLIDNGELEKSLISKAGGDSLAFTEVDAGATLGVKIDNVQVSVPVIPTLFRDTSIKLSFLRENYAKQVVTNFVDVCVAASEFKVSIDKNDAEYKAAAEIAAHGMYTAVGVHIGRVISQSKYASDRARSILLAHGKEVGLSLSQTELTFADKKKIIEIVMTCFTRELEFLSSADDANRFRAAIENLLKQSAFASNLLMSATSVITVK